MNLIQQLTIVAIMKVTQIMQRTRAIMVIEDDPDDQELLEETFRSLDYPNPVIFFSDGHEALNYLHQTDAPPAIIISDINMPKINGIEIRKRINRSPELRKLDIPFVFLTTLSQKGSVGDACSVSDHGFFTKPNSMEDLRNTIKTILEYWVQRHTPALYFRQPDRANS
jgi:CheY-like chemotaxis protein